MRNYQKILAVTAVLAVGTLAGCASDEPARTSVIVVPSTAQAAPSTQTAAMGVRRGTVIAAQNIDAASGTSSMGSASSGSSSASGAASGSQLVTVQFEDGQRQLYQVGPGGQQFQVGDRVMVNATQGTTLIIR